MLLSDKAMASEFASIFESLRKCLELRDKYMLVSGQRLGFNPKDHDGHFFGLPDGIGTKKELFAPQDLEHQMYVFHMIFDGVRINDNIVQIDVHKYADIRRKDMIHYCLISSRSVDVTLLQN